MSNNLIHHIRSQNYHPIVVVGNHPPIIQSMLDFDYLCAFPKPQILGVIGHSDGYLKVFWGSGEWLLPTYAGLESFQRTGMAGEVGWFVNVLSARRSLSSVKSLSVACPRLQGGVIFAEGVTEQHALAIYTLATEKELTIVGPATVGLLVPGHLKLGAIGGVDPALWTSQDITSPGDTAIISGSGGMTGELISLVYQSGRAVSFALSFGGDRFPTCTPEDAFLIAQGDPQTQTIIYYGELGGDDEYRLIELIKKGKVTKRVIAHIAGTVGELSPESPQFGHAKAKARLTMEKTSEKRKAMKAAGIIVMENFGELSGYLNNG